MRRKKDLSTVIWIVIILSIFLYFLGVMSGIYAGKLFEKNAEENLNSLRSDTSENLKNLEQGTKEEIDFIKESIKFMENSINSIQAAESFSNILPKNDSCTFSKIALEKSLEELRTFWEVLPFRIEAYEKNANLSEEYLLLKKKYNFLSVTTWIASQKIAKDCNENIISGLYFYSKDCKGCIEQGEELDNLQASLKDPLFFTIDFSSEDPLIALIKEYYNITLVPAIVINDNVFQGDVTPSKKILEVLS